MTNAVAALWIARMEQVEWAKLDYAYGNSCDVSALIRTIVFGSEAAACNACTTLHDELVHQSSIYSSTYEAIPFLIDALATTPSKSPRRLAVLKLLDSIAESCLHWIELEETFESTSTEEREKWAPSDKWIRRVWLGSDLFVQMLHDDKDPDVRTYIAHLLGMLVTLGPSSVSDVEPGRYGSVVTALVARLEGNERDDLVQASVVFAVARAARHDPALIGWLREACAKSNLGEKARLAAVLSVMEIDGGKHVTLEDVDLLINAMLHAAATDRPQPEAKAQQARYFPWTASRFSLIAGLCDWSAGDVGRMERILPALLTGIGLASGYTADSYLYPVFNWLWPGRHPKPAEGEKFEFIQPPAITPAEIGGIARQVIQACYDNPAIWEPAIGNTNMVFRDVGLPETREGLKELLARSG
jgi:hypothetical protein